jgi:hypothetical protein
MIKTYMIYQRVRGNRWECVGAFDSANHDRANVRENLRRYLADQGCPLGASLRRYSARPVARVLYPAQRCY